MNSAPILTVRCANESATVARRDAERTGDGIGAADFRPRDAVHESRETRRFGRQGEVREVTKVSVASPNAAARDEYSNRRRS
jgi:hypothetical protein